MSDVLSSLATTTRNVSGLAAQVAGAANAIDNSGNSFAGGEWWQQLQPGSWRGVGFVLDAGETRAGRRIALHEYPYRDDAWAEDLGKLPRRFTVQGFLVGDDVYQQRDNMLAACEQAGAGTLVHPTLGSIQCVLLEPLSVTDRRERGRYVELQFSFILSGDVQYPATAIATAQAITSAASALNAASQSDLGAALGKISIVPSSATACVGQFAGQATSGVDDATRIMGSVRGLQGFYGRFANGSLSTLQPSGATASSLLSAATTSRSTVYAAAANLQQLAGQL